MIPEQYHELLTNILFLEIMDNIDACVMIIDKETRIVYVNKAYEETFHVRSAKILGKKLDDLEGNTIAVQVVKTGKRMSHLTTFLKSVNIDSVGVSFPLIYQDELIGGVSVFNNTKKYVELAARLERTKEMNRFLNEKLNESVNEVHSKDFITGNIDMKHVLGLALKVSKTNATVLLRGESGTGKEVMAKIIHNNSERSKGPFIKVNCAAIPDNLLESELFGYVGGAFTGAKKEGKAGKFERAQGGTIFLDEIGDMNINMQVKLLRVLQEREVERIGGNKPIPLDVRIIAATNQNLEQFITDGKFRQDLYYRLNVIEIDIMPLRDRKEDIPLLIRYLIKKIGGENIEVDPKVIRILSEYNWPGNVRELQNVIEHAYIMRTDNIIDVDSLPAAFRPKHSVELCVEKKNSYNLKKMTATLEKQLILEVLDQFPNKSKAIKELGISRSSFYEKIRKYNIEVEDMDIE